jgi:hypothetical protein
MDKQEWIKHCKWLNTFRGKIVNNENQEKTYKKHIKKNEKKKKNS